MIVLNENTFTRQSSNPNQQHTSPDISIITNNLAQHTTWEVTHHLSSDHLPLLININTKIKFKQPLQKRSYTNYTKPNWQEFSKEIEENNADPDTIVMYIVQMRH